MVLRAALDGEYAQDGSRVERPGAQSVDGLGRKRDQTPALENLRSLLNRGGIGPVRVDLQYAHCRATFTVPRGICTCHGPMVCALA